MSSSLQLQLVIRNEFPGTSNLLISTVHVVSLAIFTRQPMHRLVCAVLFV